MASVDHEVLTPDKPYVCHLGDATHTENQCSKDINGSTSTEHISSRSNEYVYFVFADSR